LLVGGGYVGVELSQAMHRFGSKVTMIDRNQRLMSKEDPDVCEAVRPLCWEAQFGMVNVTLNVTHACDCIRPC
jgi:pyruvate/2-oxoglutarate dehydrogenase complex dihydrolipoamide dehydrogenase (E3) component